MTNTATPPAPESRVPTDQAGGNGVYLAARFSRRHECHALAKVLQEQGYRITSRWVKPEADHVLPTGISAQAADDERRRFATEDVADVQAASWTISLMEEPRSNTRGGRHIEFGIALALGHRLTIIGPRETVFHHLPQVEHFDTAEQFLAALTPATFDQAVPSGVDGLVERALQYATDLALALHEKHFAHVTQWKPLPDLIGVLTQIDNMTAALSPVPASAYQAMRDALETAQTALDAYKNGGRNWPDFEKWQEDVRKALALTKSPPQETGEG